MIVKTEVNEIETMNVGELIDKLSQYPRDIPAIFTWEGQYVMIRDYQSWKGSTF